MFMLRVAYVIGKKKMYMCVFVCMCVHNLLIRTIVILFISFSLRCVTCIVYMFLLDFMGEHPDDI